MMMMIMRTTQLQDVLQFLSRLSQDHHQHTIQVQQHHLHSCTISSRVAKEKAKGLVFSSLSLRNREGRTSKADSTHSTLQNPIAGNNNMIIIIIKQEQQSLNNHLTTIILCTPKKAYQVDHHNLIINIHISTNYFIHIYSDDLCRLGTIVIIMK